MSKQAGRLARHLDSIRPYLAPLGSLGVRGGGILAGFIVTMLVGRWFGPVANGQYALVTQTAIFMATIAIGGLDLAVVREFSRAVVTSQRISRTSIVMVLAQTILLSGVLAAIMLVTSGHLFDLLGRPSMPEGTLLVLCLILFSRTLTRMLASIQRSQSLFLSSQAVETLLVPGFTAIALLAGFCANIGDVLTAAVIAGGFAVLVGALPVFARSTNEPGGLHVPPRQLYATAWPLWGVAITQNLADWYGLAAITAIGGLADTGTYRVASQVATSFSIITLGLFGTYSTRISAAFHANDTAEAARIAAQATWLSVALVVPAVSLCFIAAPSLLGLVGPEFAENATVLRILLVGQVGFAFGGSASTVLAMSGHPRVNLYVNLFTTAAILVLAPMAIRWWGANGLAGFIATTAILKAIVCMIAIRRLEAIDVITGKLISHR